MALPMRESGWRWLIGRIIPCKIGIKSTPDDFSHGKILFFRSLL
jgi:hypothetical protein